MASNEKYRNESKITLCVLISILSIASSLFFLYKTQPQLSLIAVIGSLAFIGFAILLKIEPHWYDEESDN